VPATSLRLRVPGIPPGGNFRGHWSKLHRDRKRFKDAVAWLCREKNVCVSPPVRVTVVYHFEVARRRDADNLSAAAKPLIDGLVPWAIPADDRRVIPQPPTIEVFNDAPRGHYGASQFVEIVVESINQEVTRES
jgi:hypothetical protein